MAGHGRDSARGRESRETGDEDLFLQLAHDDHTDKDLDSEGQGADSGRPNDTSYGRPVSMPPRSNTGDNTSGGEKRSARNTEGRWRGHNGLVARSWNHTEDPSSLSSPMSDPREHRSSSRHSVSSRLTYQDRIARSVSGPTQSDRRRTLDPPGESRVPARRPLGERYVSMTVETGRLDEDYEQKLPEAAGDEKNSPDGTDSVDSQTAQSTVWDELDELKSRIKNLEYRGGPKTTSGAANTSRSGERPRTATTAPTTISSSPRQQRKIHASPSDVPVGGANAARLHPTLHAALAKAKESLSIPLYSALEASAADALSLAALLGSGGPQGTAYSAASIFNGVTVSERQIRRKADSMCRNLTDLCIALCDAKNEQLQQLSSPISTFTSHRASSSPRYTRQSAEPEDDVSEVGSAIRNSPRRSYSRLEDRRASLGINSVTSHDRQESLRNGEKLARPASVAARDYASRYTPGRGQRSRLGEEYDAEPSARPPSRAMTEVGQSRASHAPRREISNTAPQRSPSLRETLAARRATSRIPEEDTVGGLASPSSTSGFPSRRYLDPARGPSSEVGSVAPSSRRRLASAEQYSTPLTSRYSTSHLGSASLTARE